MMTSTKCPTLERLLDYHKYYDPQYDEFPLKTNLNDIINETSTKIFEKHYSGDKELVIQRDSKKLKSLKSQLVKSDWWQM